MNASHYNYLPHALEHPGCEPVIMFTYTQRNTFLCPCYMTNDGFILSESNTNHSECSAVEWQHNIQTWPLYNSQTENSQINMS